MVGGGWWVWYTEKLSLFSGEPWPSRVVWSLYPHISWTVEVGSFGEGCDLRRNYFVWLRLSPKRETALFHQQPRFLASGGDSGVGLARVLGSERVS